MAQALELAREALRDGEVPVGCVVEKDGAIIGRGRNRRERSLNALAHAELEAISAACAAVGSWRLSGARLFVTLEPCPMCAGAILNARIPRIYYGAREDLSGSCGSVINLFMENYGFSPEIYGGLMAEESAELLRRFFAEVRRERSGGQEAYDGSQKPRR